jgi:long-chain fatty acid transport protein
MPPLPKSRPLPLFPAFWLTVLLLAPPAWAQSGHVLNGIGAAGQGWAGAGMANPQDGLTALHWNPGALTHTTRSTLYLSMQMLAPSGTVASTVNQGAFGPFGPPATLSGSTDSNAGPFPIPALGYIHASEDSPWVFGFSAFGVGGFGVDYDLDPNNPILTPQPPNGFGFGQLVSEFALLQVSPTAAYRLSDRVSVGFAPTFNYATLKVGPFPAASPDDANGDGFPTYPRAPKAGATGFGAQAGIQYDAPSGLRLAASIKTPQWFSDFSFDAADEVGNPRTLTFRLDYPMILSAGIGYTGPSGFDAALDVRYIDFENAKGFDEVGFDQTGAVRGFGWKSIVVVAVGLQYRLTERLPVRIGYSYNENPVKDEVAFFNTAAPAIIQQRLGGGFSYVAGDRVTLEAALQYGFKNSIEGPWEIPGFGPAPGTSVKHELATFIAVVGVNVRL